MRKRFVWPVELIFSEVIKYVDEGSLTCSLFERQWHHWHFPKRTEPMRFIAGWKFRTKISLVIGCRGRCRACGRWYTIEIHAGTLTYGYIHKQLYTNVGGMINKFVDDIPIGGVLIVKRIVASTGWYWSLGTFFKNSNKLVMFNILILKIILFIHVWVYKPVERTIN